MSTLLRGLYNLCVAALLLVWLALYMGALVVMGWEDDWKADWRLF